MFSVATLFEAKKSSIGVKKLAGVSGLPLFDSKDVNYLEL